MLLSFPCVHTCQKGDRCPGRCSTNSPKGPERLLMAWGVKQGRKTCFDWPKTFFGDSCIPNLIELDPHHHCGHVQQACFLPFKSNWIVLNVTVAQWLRAVSFCFVRPTEMEDHHLDQTVALFLSVLTGCWSQVSLASWLVWSRWNLLSTCRPFVNFSLLKKWLKLLVLLASYRILVRNINFWVFKLQMWFFPLSLSYYCVKLNWSSGLLVPKCRRFTGGTLSLRALCVT